MFDWIGTLSVTLIISALKLYWSVRAIKTNIKLKLMQKASMMFEVMLPSMCFWLFEHFLTLNSLN